MLPTPAGGIVVDATGVSIDEPWLQDVINDSIDTITAVAPSPVTRVQVK